MADFMGTAGVDAFILTGGHKKHEGLLDDDGDEIHFRTRRDYDALLSFVSDDRTPQGDKNVATVNPHMYNHPRFYIEEAVYQAQSKLPKLSTQSKDDEPSLYRAVPLSNDSFVHNGVPHSIAAHQATDTQSDMIDIYVSGYRRDSRGRSRHRSVYGPTLNRPRAAHAHGIVNNTRRPRVFGPSSA